MLRARMPLVRNTSLIMLLGMLPLRGIAQKLPSVSEQSSTQTQAYLARSRQLVEQIRSHPSSTVSFKSPVPHDKVAPANPLFSYSAEYDSGGCWANSVALKDINGDGKLDLLVVNAFGPTNQDCSMSGPFTNASIGVLLGNGDGTFQAAVAFDSGGLFAESVAVADVNGDGKPDLLVVNGACADSNCVNGNVGVLLGNGDGTFQAVATYDSGGSQAYSIAVADVNGDGKPDLLVANGVLFGNGDGTFQAVATYGPGESQVNSIAVADVNGDGKPDLLVANGVLLGNGDGTFQAAVAYDSGGLYPDSVAVADVNGDGKPDLLVANGCAFNQEECANGSAGVLLGNGDGTFQPAASYLSPGQFALSLVVGDVNQDGKPDLLLYNSSLYTTGDFDGVVNVLLGNGDGTFQPATSYEFGGNPYRQNLNGELLALGDVNGDGKLDMVVTSPCYGFGLNEGGLCGGKDDGSVGVFLNVSQLPTSTSLVSSGNPSTFGQPVTFTASVTSQGPNTATGTITFNDGSTTLGISLLNGGSATFLTRTLAIGPHSIEAIYSGDGNFTGSVSSNLSQVVTKSATTTTLLSSINPSVPGKPVTLTALVSSLAGTPTGKVEYLNGTTVLATVTLTSGSAKYTTSKLPPGANKITAVYQGDSNNSGSTSASLIQVVLATTTTTLTSSPDPSAYGQTVTFTAKVNSSIGAPLNGETVTFKQGVSVLGMGILNGGSATFSTSTLGVGTRAIKALYGGDARFGSSTSATASQVIHKAASTTTLISSQNPSTLGQPVTFTATVAPQFSGVLTGKFVFRDGTTVLKTVPVTGDSGSFTTSKLAKGAHNLTVTYNGGSDFTTSSASLTQNVP
jgi:hypothetical protein